MGPLAHIGNIPVEEWLPFLVPVVALYFYGRRKERHRHKEVRRLPPAGELLDERTVERVLDRWGKSRYEGASAKYLPVLYPPGPDGMTVAQLANRTNCDSATIERLLTDLEELGYVDLDGYEGADLTVSLTIEGYDVVELTESVLLAVARERCTPQLQPH